MLYRVLFLGVVVGLMVCTLAYADIPKVINFQGRLTDASGKFVLDGNYSLTFRIYTDSTGGSAKWSERQSVAVSKGLFNVILGSSTPIPDSIFSYPNTWLGIQAEADPEMTPRQRLSSLGYSYRTAKADSSSYSLNSDKLDGLDASAFSSPATDYGRSGVATDLYEGTSTLSSKYVNEGQANSISSGMITDSEISNADISASANISPSKISGTAWTSTNDGSGSGLDADLLDGQHSTAFLSTGNDYGRSGVATDLYEGTSTLTSKYVNSSGPDSVIATSGTAFLGKATGNSIYPMVGVKGYAKNSYSTSYVYGGYFATSDSGSGPHYGVYGAGYGSEAGANVYGFYGYAGHSSLGSVYGGYFATSSSGGGERYGIWAEGQGSSVSPTYGSHCSAENSSSGDALGGYFAAYGSGTGKHYGVKTYSYGVSDSDTYGIHSYGSNSSTGNTYGGYFETNDVGTGRHYGVRATGYGSSSSDTYGAYGEAYNTSTGPAYGGFFQTSSDGTGSHYGVYGLAQSYSTSPQVTFGVSGYAFNPSSGDASGGSFTAYSEGTGYHYGVRGWSYGSSSAHTYGAYGYAENTSSGDAIGGHFTNYSAGTGAHYAVYANSYGASSADVRGVYGYARNTSTGAAYGGYFSVSSSGTGVHYGVWGQEVAGGTGAAVYAAGDMIASGTKPAVLKTSKGHRLFYAQESPEVWFEDFGEGQLINGKAHIELDPLFLEAVTINTLHPMKVFIQLNDENCKGTAVKRGSTGFDVIELSNGTSNASFSYRVVAKRKGYEDERLRETDVGKDDPNLYPELWREMEKRHQEEETRMEEERKIREEEQKRMEQERIEMEKDQKQ